MRIITGKKARYKLIPPKDKTTRPIPDMVKEALFSILGSKIENTTVADLFSGTGSIGLEAISRGAAHAVFVDMDREAITRLRQNIDKLEFHDQSSVVSSDIFKFGLPGAKFTGGHSNYDIVFCDPPFPLAREVDENSRLGKLMTKINKQIEFGATVIVRNEKKFPMLDSYADLKIYDRRTYGIMTLNFYKKEK